MNRRLNDGSNQFTRILDVFLTAVPLRFAIKFRRYASLVRLPSLSTPIQRFALASAIGLALLAQSALPGHTGGRQDVSSTGLPCLLSPKAKGVIVLFSGSAEELAHNFTHVDGTAPTWNVLDDGSMQARNGNLITKQMFRDVQLHAEFKVPSMPNAVAQDRGSGGIVFMSRLQIQILDSFGIDPPGVGDCGAIHNATAPLVNACKAPEEWQSFDIIFRAPIVEANTNKRLEKASVTVFLNGVLVQNNTVIQGPTGTYRPKGDGQGHFPLLLQVQGNPIAFRNIWVLPLSEAASPPAGGREEATGISQSDSSPDQGVYNWQDVPKGQQIPVQSARFDQGGYHIFCGGGETIEVPFLNQNLDAMKFGVSSTGQAYFVNDGTAPVYYLANGGYLENAAVQNTRWYPFTHDYTYSAPIYVSVAPDWNGYTAMGWYPGMVVYGGRWSYGINTAHTRMPGYSVIIDGSTYTNYKDYLAYYQNHPGYVQNRLVYRYTGRRTPGIWGIRHARGRQAVGGTGIRTLPPRPPVIRTGPAPRPGGRGGFGNGGRLTPQFGIAHPVHPVPNQRRRNIPPKKPVKKNRALKR